MPNGFFLFFVFFLATIKEVCLCSEQIHHEGNYTFTASPPKNNYMQTFHRQVLDTLGAINF